MNIYILILIILLIIYVYSYFIYNETLIILQSSLSDFNFDILLKKHPIVIQDKIQNIIPVIDSWFSHNIINNIIIDNKNWLINNYKYLIIYVNDDTNILIHQPNNNYNNYNIPNENIPLIEIKLKKNQFIILPFKWRYKLDENINNNINIYGVHDYITYFLHTIF